MSNDKLAEALHKFVQKKWNIVVGKSAYKLGQLDAANEVMEILRAHESAAEAAQAQDVDVEVLLRLCIEKMGSVNAVYERLLAASPQQAAEPVEAIGCLSIRRFRGCDSMVNHDFDYFGSLPDGDYRLYTHPQPAQDAKDAARYRWLRDKSGRAGSPYIRCDHPPFKPMDYWITAGTADSCIDRAMAKESGR